MSRWHSLQLSKIEGAMTEGARLGSEEKHEILLSTKDTVLEDWHICP